MRIETFEKAFVIFKYSLYALLAVNIYLFFRHATFHEGLDAAGWVLLLAIFEWMTRKDKYTPATRLEARLMLLAQAAAYGLILYAWGNYYMHGQWLDFINATLWLAVVIFIEVDMRAAPDRTWRRHRLHHLLKAALYVSLTMVAVVWGVKGDALNFYDAFLWIVCFFAIELNVLRRVFHQWQKRQPAAIQS